MKNFTEVVLTGGPAAGKSSTLAYLVEHFQDLGVRVLYRSELATFMITGGLSDINEFATNDREKYLEIERAMLMMSVEMRKHYQAMARIFAPDPVVIVYDRAEMDVASYVTPEEFKALLAEHSLTRAEVCDSYDAVIHLRSAATKVPHAYTLENNPARRESDLSDAIEADRRTLAAWTGSPHLWVVEAQEDFDAKRNHVARIVHHTLGIPEPLEIERKFLLRSEPDLAKLPEHVVVDITQTYLKSAEEDVEVRVRKRSQDGQATHFWTEKRKRTDSEGVLQRIEREEIVKPSDYLRYLEDADPNKAPLTKRRHCFVHEGNHLELDRITLASGDVIWVLEAELLESGQKLDLPEYLDIEREVTEEKAFSSSALASTS